MAEHSGDVLSALLDGELAAAEAAVAREHVASCAECARELGAVREARRLLRELPAVEPPSTFLDDLLAAGAADDAVVPLPPRRRGAMLAGLAAASVAVAAAVAVVVAAPWSSTDTLDPELEVALEHHDSTVGALEDEGVIDRGTTRLTGQQPAPPTTAEVQPLDEVDDDFDTPAELAGYELVGAYEVGDGVHLVYRSGAYGLSVFMREGEVDFDDLPAGGTRVEVAGRRAWRWDDMADGRLLVIEGDDVVITIAGDEPGDAVLDVAGALMKS